MNVKQRQAAADPQTKPRELGCESASGLLSFTTTISNQQPVFYRPDALPVAQPTVSER